MIAEALYDSVHPKTVGKGTGHSMGSIFKGECGNEDGFSVHHNLYAHNAGRNPMLQSDVPESIFLDFRNNVIHHWYSYGAGQTNGEGDIVRMNYISNYLRRVEDESTRPSDALQVSTPREEDYVKIYFSNTMTDGNYVNDINELVWPDGFKAESNEFDIPWAYQVTTKDANNAYESVLAGVGAALPVRDAVDSRIIRSVIEKEDAFIHDGEVLGRERGFIDDEHDVGRGIGGWPTLTSCAAPNDADNDGMPDYWETARNLDPNDPNDGPKYDLSNIYTNVEVYLNWLVPEAGKSIYITDRDGWYSTIQAAIDDADNGDVIKVHPGTYIENIDFKGKSITVESTWPGVWEAVESTIIDGSGANVVEFGSGEGGNSVLKGFTLAGGEYGIYCSNSVSPVISNCIIRDNNSDGIYCTSSSPEIKNSKIMSNSGDGIYVYDATSVPVIKNNLIYENDKGIAFADANSGSIVRNNTIVYNDSNGIYVGSVTEPNISNCILWGNDDDLADCSATYSCIEDGDSGTGNISSNPRLVNSFDFVDETDANGTTTTINVADASLYEVDDVIEYDNDGIVRTVTNVNTTTDIITFKYALDANSTGGVHIRNWGRGVDDPIEDFHLKPSSPCVNAGDPSGVYTGETDIDFEARVTSDDVDMGADEGAWVHNITQGNWDVKIQDAIDDANEGDIITVYPGVYYETINFNDKAITLQCTDAKDWDVIEATIIDANDLGANVVTFGSGDGDSVLTGFTLTGGNYGVHCTATDPNIFKCILEDNNSHGIYCASGSPKIWNNKIINNDGDGIYSSSAEALEIENNLIYNNDKNGIEFSNVSSQTTVFNNTIVYNDSNGIYVSCVNEPNIMNCIIWGSDAWEENDANDLYGCSATYSCIEDCNDAGGNGNICGDGNDPCFVNIFDFVDETTADGTVYLLYVADASLYTTSHTIEYDDDGVARFVEVIDTVNNTLQLKVGWYLDSSSEANVHIRKWGSWQSADPEEDFHLYPGYYHKDTDSCTEVSPCVDAGDPNTTTSDVGTIDLDGSNRFRSGLHYFQPLYDEIVDMGAYEGVIPY
jgi:parallel beta-helix repeat protein